MSEELLGPVLNFFHSMAAIAVTDAEYALLVATSVLCSGLRPSHNFQLTGKNEPPFISCSTNIFQISFPSAVCATFCAMGAYRCIILIIDSFSFLLIP